MELYISIPLFIVALILVIKGGDVFVNASIKIATKSKIPTIIVGATIVMSGLITLGMINNNREEYSGIVSSCLVVICSIIGITCASGMFFAAFCTTLLTVFAMFVLKVVEKSMVKKVFAWIFFQ